jgi:hypothetical protein
MIPERRLLNHAFSGWFENLPSETAGNLQQTHKTLDKKRQFIYKSLNSEARMWQFINPTL